MSDCSELTLFLWFSLSFQNEKLAEKPLTELMEEEIVLFLMQMCAKSILAQ